VDRTFVYVDGESHYNRCECAWKAIAGSDATLDRIRLKGEKGNGNILTIPEARVMWCRKWSAGVQRAVYFTSVVSNPENIHAIKVQLRNVGLDQHVILEPKQLAERRANILRDAQLIEKAKGVDIALAVRMLEESHSAFDVCHLYTSDVDFLPVIHAVKTRGKRVFVYGYKNGLGKNSELLTVPDLFVDLEQMLRDECELAPLNDGEAKAG
jgi:uncharacterized LabA/DUF88 family protein